MIRYLRGNIFESDARTLVNTVNCVGVMGKGLAKEFKDRFPRMFDEYARACRHGEVRSGRPFIYREIGRNILCFPTKDNWKGPSKYEFIEAGLKAIRDNHDSWRLESLAVPPLGCGLGGLEWSKVRGLIERYLGDLPMRVDVYEPIHGDARVDTTRPRRKVQRVNITLPLALVGEIVMTARDRLHDDAALGKLLMQKFVFFAQARGVPIELRFDKYKLGPFDHRLNHMIERLEGLFIRDASTSWARSDLRILDRDAWRNAVAPLEAAIEPYRRSIAEAVELLANRPLEEVELLATVLYAWNALIATGYEPSADDVADYVAEWSEDKRIKFDRSAVHAALRELDGRAWMGPPAEGPAFAPPGERLTFSARP